MEIIDTIAEELSQVTFPEKLQLMATYQGDEQIHILTTFERELMYNIEHTIHHLAIIKIAIRLVAPHIRLPDNFGVAASTIKHRDSLCAQ